MKTFSIIALILSVLIIAVSIYENQYHCMFFAIMSGLLAWAMWPEKKKGKPYRNNITWVDYET